MKEQMLIRNRSILVIYILIFLTIYFERVYAQGFQFDKEIDTIPVSVNSLIIDRPFSGGYDWAKPAFADIDNDNDFDLFIGTFYGNILFYRNIGTSSNASFKYETNEYTYFNVGLYTAPTFIDIDNDSDLDMFVGEYDGNLNFFLNTGSSSNANFILETDSLIVTSPKNGIVPTFVDLDNDLDFDLILGELNKLTLYRNNGSQFAPVFIDETLIEGSSHWFAPALIDIDDDDDLDLFIGNSGGQIDFYRNTGTSTNFNFTFETYEFSSIELNQSVPTFIDIDNDSDFDLFVGERDGFLNLYKNSGSPSTPNFTFETKLLDNIDVGGLSTPTLVDIDNDEDLDMFIGERFGNIHFYRNTGTKNSPYFEFETEDFDSIDYGWEASLSFADIDNDSDLDLFIGEDDRRVNFLRNVGIPNEPEFEFNMEFVVGDKSAPALADIDNDNDFDLFVGEFDGSISFFKNNGTGNTPNFILAAANYSSINIGQKNAPTFVDLDRDGDLDLCIGEANGNLNYFENSGTDKEPLFSLLTESLISDNVRFRSYPAFADIDNDGDADLFLGHGDGGVFFYRNNADLSSPEIIHTPTTLASATQNLLISADIEDNIETQAAIVFYRQGGNSIYNSMSMLKNGTTWEVEIPESLISERGFEYYILAQDASGNKTTFPSLLPEENPIIIQVATSNLTFTSPAFSYRIISFPLELYNKEPKDVLDELGLYEPTQWRLLRYVNGQNHEYPNIGNFETGNGFWLITRDTKTLNIGSGKSVTTDSNFVLTLQPGWNQIGNPFAFPVNWNDVTRSENVENILVGYFGSKNDETGYDFTHTQLLPFQGYFVNNNSEIPTTIAIPPKAADNTNNLNKQFKLNPHSMTLENTEWVLKIVAQAGFYIDKDNYIGALENAINEYDQNDFSEAPFFASYVSLYFPHEEWKTRSKRYSGDFRKPNSCGHYWDFTLVSNILDSLIILSFSKVSNLPHDWSVSLLDKEKRLLIPLHENETYKFINNGSKRDFRLIVGKTDFLKYHDWGFEKSLSDFRLSQNYPNPFNPSTKIKYQVPIASHISITIYDILGKEVAIVANERKDAGLYEAIWSGLDKNQAKVSSGVYIVRIKAKNFVDTKKMLLIR